MIRKNNQFIFLLQDKNANKNISKGKNFVILYTYKKSLLKIKSHILVNQKNYIIKNYTFQIFFLNNSCNLKKNGYNTVKIYDQLVTLYEGS